jgi:hypothetical protein
MRMLIPDVIFILRTAVKAQDLNLPSDNKILLLRTINLVGKKIFILYCDKGKRNRKGHNSTVQHIINTPHVSSFKTKSDFYKGLCGFTQQYIFSV